MTAEIAIMNKRAIAFATDSAVTIGNRNKVYNTANKLFMLSKYQPVGIMVYSNAEFMGVPWEIIIKEYRKQLELNKKDCLIEYGQDFIEKLKTNNYGFNNYEENYYIQTVVPLINEINENIEKQYSKSVEKLKRKLDISELKNIIHKKIDEYHNIINKEKDLENIPNNFIEKINESYNTVCQKYIDEIIGINNIDKQYVTKLIDTCNMIFKKDIFVGGYTGIVIAGFGDKDIFPSLVSYKISGMIKGFLKYKQDDFNQVTIEHDYYILPFAQVDTVNTFLHGISSSYLEVIEKSFNTHILGEINAIDSNILDLDGKNKVINDLSHKWQEVMDGIADYSHERYFYPILRAIRFLPIDELASMAESLVNLTSFKRQVAVDENAYTVGGPIDVAVISKGDGFVWIKRKHYFKSEFNHHFFENYYNENKRGIKEGKNYE